ncbi:MAG: hypothetical protein HYX52_02670 [Chloroflexi bacterium]|nr:hypothetical protein [Chloroflexota bacterium]
MPPHRCHRSESNTRYVSVGSLSTEKLPALAEALRVVLALPRFEGSL